MDASAIANAANAFSTAQVGDAESATVLKKALEVEAQGAAALVNALSRPAANLPAHLGQNINTVA